MSEDTFSTGIGEEIANALNYNEPPFAWTRRIRSKIANREVDWNIVAEVVASRISGEAAKKLPDFIPLQRAGALRFLSNIYDPTKEDARLRHIYSFHAYGDPRAMEHEWQQHLRWVNENLIGEPKATEAYTVEQLKGMGMVGVYAKDKSDESQHQSNG